MIWRPRTGASNQERGLPPTKQRHVGRRQAGQGQHRAEAQEEHAEQAPDTSRASPRRSGPGSEALEKQPPEPAFQGPPRTKARRPTFKADAPAHDARRCSGLEEALLPEAQKCRTFF